MLSLTATTSAAPRPIDSMNITGGSVIWSLPGGIPQHIIFSDFGANTNLVGGYIGVGGSTRDPFEPPDPDNILFFPVDELNNAVTYTAESNLGTSTNPPGVIPGGPVPTGTLDESLNTIEMDLSSWFGNLNNFTDIWAGTGDLNDGFTSPIATGSWNPATFEYVLTWKSMVPEGSPFATLMSTWTLEGYAYPVIAVSIMIDIKPGSNENPINPRSRGKVPVAILTTEEFDASTVDVSTVHFGPDGAQPVHYALEDVDGDTDWDLVLHFNTQETGITCGDTEATLMGQTLDDVQITGTGSIKTVGCKKK
jgi:hypothetical protein